MKQLILKNYTSISAIALTIIACGTLLLLRIKYTHSYLFLFLVWNLFLAFIPYFVSFYLKERTNLGKIEIITALFIWLFFLPNAPYIVTDFIHLSLDEGIIIWIDIVLLFSFSIAGLLLYLFSLQHIQNLVLQQYNSFITKFFLLSVPFLCGFGIYLGRFERWNTWDIIQNPFQIITNSYQLLFDSPNSVFVWLFSIGFGLFLMISNVCFKMILKKYTS